MTLLLSLIFTMTPSHAGFLARICSNLVADDPWQHEGADVEWVAKHYDRLCTASLWRKLTDLEASDLKILRGELQRRQSFGSEYDRDVADITLIRCAK